MEFKFSTVLIFLKGAKEVLFYILFACGQYFVQYGFRQVMQTYADYLYFGKTVFLWFFFVFFLFLCLSGF